MSFESLSPALRELIERPGILTERQREAVKLTALGYSGRRLARALGIDAKTARDLLERAHRNLRKAVDEEGLDLG